MRVLHVEDNAGDRALACEAAEIAGWTCQLIQVHTADEARRELAEAPADLILLDFNLPGTRGSELLAEIRQQTLVPVIILSSSADKRDIRSSYQLQANAYVQKPTDFDGFVQLFEAIHAFWLTCVRPPPAHDAPDVPARTD